MLTLMAVDRAGATAGNAGGVGVGRPKRGIERGVGVGGVGGVVRGGSEGAGAEGPLRNLVLLIRCAWGLAVLLSMPQVFIFSMKAVNKQGTVVDCWAEFGGSKTFEKVYFSFSSRLWTWPQFKLLYIFFFFPGLHNRLSADRLLRAVPDHHRLLLLRHPPGVELLPEDQGVAEEVPEEDGRRRRRTGGPNVRAQVR